MLKGNSAEAVPFYIADKERESGEKA